MVSYLFHPQITERAKLDGLPDQYLSLYAQNANEKGYPEARADVGPWVITLDDPSSNPALQYITDRALREELFMAKVRRES